MYREIQDEILEALFKIITDKNTFYYAVQGPKLLRLTLTEELFSAYVDGFYSARQ